MCPHLAAVDVSLMAARAGREAVAYLLQLLERTRMPPIHVCVRPALLHVCSRGRRGTAALEQHRGWRNNSLGELLRGESLRLWTTSLPRLRRGLRLGML